MSPVHQALERTFDPLLRPLPPLIGLSLVSLLAAVIALLVFKATSNQVKLASLRRSMIACLFEIRLWPDDARAILRALGEMLRLQTAVLRWSLAPLLCLAIPMLLIIEQLESRYSHHALRPTDRFLVCVRLEEPLEGRSQRPEARLQAPDGLIVETPALWIPSENELDWRLRADRLGDYQLKITVDGEDAEKQVRVAADAPALSPLRKHGIWGREAPLPNDGKLQSIAVRYPAVELHWMALFLGLSAAFALGLRRRFRVEL